ncbi:MAG: hypothetical protein JSS02_12230 [Planctomycetes bacterium]|nr:hypothetical protein [Planctomycetota bacterium]
MGRPEFWQLRRLGAACLVLVCCGLARGDSLSSEERGRRLQEIAGKSTTERSRLQRNFAAFRKLDPQEQNLLRQFARELREDDRTGGGKLRRTMQQFYDWYLTLTPGQAADLRNETDPVRRDRIVRELLKQQQEVADATGDKAGARTPQGLNAEDLDAVLQVVERAIQRYLSPAEIEQLKKKEGYARHVYVLDLAFQTRPGTGPLAPPQWWRNEVLEEMIDAVNFKPQKFQLKNNVDRGPRVILLQLLMAGVTAEYDRVYAQLKPSQETLERYFVQLSSAEQDGIMRLPFDQQQPKLQETYLAKMAKEAPDQFPKPPKFDWFQQRLKFMRQAAQRGNRANDGQKPTEGTTSSKEAGAAKKGSENKKKAKQGKSNSTD